MQFVSESFVTQQQIDVWYDEDYVYNNNEMIKWYDSYKARRVFYLSPGILMVWWTGVCQRREEAMEVTDSCF